MTNFPVFFILRLFTFVLHLFCFLVYLSVLLFSPCLTLSFSLSCCFLLSAINSCFSCTFIYPSFFLYQDYYMTMLLGPSSCVFLPHLINYFCPLLCLSLHACMFIVHFAFEREPALFETFGQQPLFCIYTTCSLGL